MEKIEIFQILGIEATKDERAIKNAYREKLAVTNPEDNPEGFKRLRTAYEEACRLAKEPDEESEEESIDDTPSGEWVAKAAEIYANIKRRQDLTQWKELFADDIFLSLEEEENCRFKLLAFMMSHYRFPTRVWKLLDEKLNLVKDRGGLREHFPGDFIHYIAVKCERGEEIEFELFEGEPTAEYDLFIQYYEQCYRALNTDELENAAGFLDCADKLGIFHPALEICRAEMLEKQGKLQDAMELLKNLKNKYPKDLVVSYNCAELFWRNNKKEEAARIFEALKADNDTHYMANVRLTEWYYEQNRCREAKKCAERVLPLGSDNEFLELLRKVNDVLEQDLEEQYFQNESWEAGLELGWCYLQDGKITRGIRLAKNIKEQIPADRQAEYKGLLCKLYVEGAEYEASLAMSKEWEVALQEKLARDETEEEINKDNDRLRQVHMIRMQCYRSLGFRDNAQFVKAIEEAESLEDGSTKDISVLLEKAYIYLEMEEYEKCLEICRKLVEEYQIYAALATSAEAYRRQWNAGGVVQSARQCINHFPDYIRGYELAAKVYLDLERKEDLLSILEEAEKNGIKSVILDAYRYQMDKEIPSTEELDQKISEFRKEYFSAVEKGDLTAYERGLPIITEYLYWYPGPYMLVERGLFHRAAKHYQEAIEDFEKALADKPNQQYALYGLSFVYKYLGDYEKAMIYIKRAICYRDEDLSYVVFADMSNLYSLMGAYEEALDAYEEFQKHDNYTNRYHMNKYAMCLARCGETDKAIEMLKKAHAEYPMAYYDEAVNIYQVTGNGDKAYELLKEWNHKILNANKMLSSDNYANYYSRSAWQELMFGSAKKAMEFFRKELNSKKHADVTSTLCDMIFAAILCGEDEEGKLYAAKLRELRAKSKNDSHDDYFEREKGRLNMNFVADYYYLSDEELEQLLETEKKCEICHFCTYYLCKEIEAVRILFMLRKGKAEVAMERLAKNLEQQPLDEYMIAIRHVGTEHVKKVAQRAQVKPVEQTEQKTEREEGFLTRLIGRLGKKK